jgi:hypothetical protein
MPASACGIWSVASGAWPLARRRGPE